MSTCLNVWHLTVCHPLDCGIFVVDQQTFWHSVQFEHENEGNTSQKKKFSFRLLALFHQLCFWSFSSQIQIFCTRNCFLGWIFMFPPPHPTFLMQLKLTFFGVKKSCTSYLNWGWGGRGRGNSGNVRKKTFFREVYPKFGKVTPTICNCCFGGRQSFQSSKVEERI